MYYSKLLKLSTPVLLSSLSVSIVNIASIPILGHYSVEAMAAVSLYTAINMVLANIFLASFSGYRILASKAFGRNDYESVNTLFNSTLLISTILVIFIFVITYFFSYQLIQAITSDFSTSLTCYKLLKINMLSYPLNTVSVLLSATLALQKQTSVNMLIRIFCSIFGVAISYLTVYGVGFFPQLGALGVAWSNVAQSIATLSLYIMIFPKFSADFKYRFIFKITDIYRTWSLSYPFMLSMFIDYLGNLILFAIISKFLGDASVASGRLGMAILLFVFSIITSISSGFSILGGRALGRGDTSLFIQIYYCNQRILLLFTIIIAIILLIMPQYVIMTLTKFQEIQKLAEFPLLIVSIVIPIMAFSYNNSTFLRLLEYVKTDMLCITIPLWFINIPLTYFLCVTVDIGLNGMFIALLVAELFYAYSSFYFVNKNIAKPIDL